MNLKYAKGTVTCPQICSFSRLLKKKHRKRCKAASKTKPILKHPFLLHYLIPIIRANIKMDKCETKINDKMGP